VAERSEVLVKNGIKTIAGLGSTLRKRYTWDRVPSKGATKYLPRIMGYLCLRIDKMKLTNELLEAAKSDRGGWNAAQLRLLGFNGFETKWRRRAVGMDITQQQYDALMAIRNEHLKRGDQAEVSFCRDDAWALETRQALLAKKNQAESHVEALLQKSLFTHKREQPIEVNGKKWFIDFYIKRLRLGNKSPVMGIALEVDGGYHFTEQQQALDRRKDKDLLCSKMVNGVIRISATKALEMDLLALSGAIVNPLPYSTKHYY
jgi:very-short-patch-repair endonuclease